MANPVITVIGAGHGGHATAADLSLAGADVRIYAMPGFDRKLDAIRERGGIELRGVGRSGFARVNVAESLEAALHGADCIFVAIHAAGHERLADACAEHLREGQALVLLTGYGGSLLFRSALRRRGKTGPILVGETVTMPYICRLTGPACVEIYGKPGARYSGLKVNLCAAIPASDTGALVARLSALYPITKGASSVLALMLLNANVMRHPLGTLFNIGRIERAHGDFIFYREAFTPSVWRVFDALDQEKMRLMRALDLAPMSYMDYRRMMSDLAIDEQAALDVKGPADAETRFLTEDVPMGLVAWMDFGRLLDVPVPTCRAVVHLASVINGRDYAEEGRTLQRLGLRRATPERLRAMVDEGLIE